jgi:HK97 family phage portal protein
VGLFSRRNKEVVNEAGGVIVGEDLLSALKNGEDITKEQALSIPAVSSAIDTIAGKISTIPLKLYKETIKDGKKFVESVQDDRCSLINEDTGDTLDGVQFKKAIVTDYLLDKGGYAFIKRNGNTTKSIHYVDAERITIVKNTDPIFKSYQIQIESKTYRDYQFIKLLRNTKDGASGESVRTEISKALLTAYQNLLMQYASAKKGGKKRGFLMTEKALTKEVLAELKQNWESLYSNDGLNSIVLPNGTKFQESTDSTFETSVNATRKQLNDEIKDIFHIGKTDAETFVNAIVPILAVIECAINRVLLLEKEKDDGLFFAFDTKEMNKGDIKSRFEAYKIGIESGFVMPNECRYLENMDELDGLSVINFGLGAVLYDPKTKSYYTPNTGEEKGLNKTKEDEADKNKTDKGDGSGTDEQ